MILFRKTFNQVSVGVISIGMVILFYQCTSAPSEDVKPATQSNEISTSDILESNTGLASFIGSIFQGKKTASGEIFNKTEMVAAHPTYPLGTVVRITNLENNDTVQVRIIDRGPTPANVKEGVIIDLSEGAAKKINMQAEGRVRVKVDVLNWGENKEN